jgi:hypothetical protein
MVILPSGECAFYYTERLASKKAGFMRSACRPGATPGGGGKCFIIVQKSVPPARLIEIAI